MDLILETVDSLMQDEIDFEYPNNENQQIVDTDHNNDFGLLSCQLV